VSSSEGTCAGASNFKDVLRAGHCVFAFAVLAVLALVRADTAGAQVEFATLQPSIVAVGYANAKGVFESYGTAFCIKSDATSSTFLTAYHVIFPKSALPNYGLVALLPDAHTMVKATLDPQRQSAAADLAVFTVPVPNIHALTLSADMPKAGHAIAAGGYPTALGGELFNGDTADVISGILTGSVMATPRQNLLIFYNVLGGSVDKGMSGGPLFDPATGAVYGVVHAAVPGARIDPISPQDRATLALKSGPVMSASWTNVAVSRVLVDEFLNGQSPAANVAMPGEQLTTASVIDSVFLASAEQGDANAQNTLGLMYQYGSNVPKDYAKALQYLQRAADQSNPDAQNNLALMYEYGRGVPQTYVTARLWFERAAQQGNAPAANNIGFMYDQGHGVTQNYALALQWYQLAAGRGNSDAQYNIGTMYDDGHGVPQDYATAMHWYQLAAAQSDDYAENNIGFLYSHGHGVPKDTAMALHWYLLAAAQGDPTAENNVGYMYDDGGGAGVPRDYVTAMHWYLLAAQDGNASGEYDVGAMYDEGHGVPQNYALALHWYQLAAAHGEPSAEESIGSLYEKGHGVTMNLATALHWYTLASAHGDVTAKTNIGGMYDDGRGVKQNYATALHWYQLAAAQGEATAENNIGYMYSHGHGVKQNYATALHWYQLAAAAGLATAQDNAKSILERLGK
jgi:uncharacterized protein